MYTRFRDERTDGRTRIFQYTHHSASGGIMSNLDRGPSKDASYQDLISEEKIFLEINQSEKRIVYGGHVC
jgi:hypothetical protein